MSFCSCLVSLDLHDYLFVFSHFFLVFIYELFMIHFEILIHLAIIILKCSYSVWVLGHWHFVYVWPCFHTWCFLNNMYFISSCILNDVFIFRIFKFSIISFVHAFPNVCMVGVVLVWSVVPAPSDSPRIKPRLPLTSTRRTLSPGSSWGWSWRKLGLADPSGHACLSLWPFKNSTRAHVSCLKVFMRPQWLLKGGRGI